jgi:hypothetical protein
VPVYPRPLTERPVYDLTWFPEVEPVDGNIVEILALRRDATVFYYHCRLDNGRIRWLRVSDVRKISPHLVSKYLEEWCIYRLRNQ